MSEQTAPPSEMAAPDLQVSVSVQHLAHHSEAARQVFGYEIRIENHDGESWQVISREWRVTDGSGRETLIQGEGVVGQQPIIAPKGVFVYDSFVTLEDVPGSMRGFYQLKNAWGQLGRVAIPAFALNVTQTRTLN